MLKYSCTLLLIFTGLLLCTSVYPEQPVKLFNIDTPIKSVNAEVLRIQPYLEFVGARYQCDVISWPVRLKEAIYFYNLYRKDGSHAKTYFVILNHTERPLKVTEASELLKFHSKPSSLDYELHGDYPLIALASQYPVKKVLKTLYKEWWGPRPFMTNINLYFDEDKNHQGTWPNYYFISESVDRNDKIVAKYNPLHGLIQYNRPKD